MSLFPTLKGFARLFEEPFETVSFTLRWGSELGTNLENYLWTSGSDIVFLMLIIHDDEQALKVFPPPGLLPLHAVLPLYGSYDDVENGNYFVYFLTLLLSYSIVIVMTDLSFELSDQKQRLDRHWYKFKWLRRHFPPDVQLSLGACDIEMQYGEKPSVN